MGLRSRVTIGLCLLFGLVTSVLIAWTAAWTSAGTRELKLIMPSQGDDWGVVQCSKKATTYFICIAPNGSSPVPLGSRLTVAVLIADILTDQNNFGTYSIPSPPSFSAAISSSDPNPAAPNVSVVSQMGDGVPSWALDEDAQGLLRLTQASGFPMLCLLSRVQGHPARPEGSQQSGALILSLRAQNRHSYWPERAVSNTLPLVPIWSGLAVNSLAYGSIPFLILVMFHRLSVVFQRLRYRTSHRRNRGHCPKCNYDLLADFTTGCPECGWNRSETPQPT